MPLPTAVPAGIVTTPADSYSRAGVDRPVAKRHPAPGQTSHETPNRRSRTGMC